MGFDPVTAAILGTALVSGVTGSMGQQSANKTNVALSRENRAWQEKMSSSAYQRAMKDMRSAGLNPILAYQRGGASTPAGSLAQVGNVGLAGAQAAQGYSTSLAQQALADKTQYETDFVLPKQMEQIDANIGLANAQTYLKNALARQSKQQVINLEEQVNLLIEQQNLTRSQALQAKTTAYMNLVAAEINELDKAGWEAISEFLGQDMGPGSTKAVIDAMTAAGNTFRGILDIIFPSPGEWVRNRLNKWKTRKPGSRIPGRRP